ncbi:sulfite exporter TauE/SafE family protein [Candidatus Soleaferrea massiliensis]|uniref:sulfite exporter TauE/SafE family protein n=1 Tax=Candidatus Soleaferrea massiliensis TaxID=1470354 RepID=UPI00058CD396|nr:sulfite exporter TauE/SafE family protein [Candidatus Soleaferrea massiliensis]
MKKKHNLAYGLIGFFGGILNGLFGAGGGMVVVPFLEKTGLEPQKSHATSISIILPLSIFSVVLYLMGGRFSIQDALIFLPSGLVGAAVGAFLLPKIPNKWLRKIFAVLIVISSIRLLLK